MDICKTQNLPRLSHKEIKNLNKPITSKEIELVTKSRSKEKLLTDTVIAKFNQIFKEELIPILQTFTKKC